MANAGYHISDSTIANVLNAHRIEPAPDRQRSHSWSTSLKAHWHSIFATDFTTVEVWTLNGLVTCYVLAVMHLKTRLVHIAGTTPNPNARCMKQVCRNITDTEDGFMKDVSHFIVNRDTCFITMRQCLEEDTNTKVVLLPPKSPDLNAYMERWFRSLKIECLNRMIFFERKSPENAVREYVEHYHAERNYQKLINHPIDPEKGVGAVAG